MSYVRKSFQDRQANYQIQSDKYYYGLNHNASKNHNKSEHQRGRCASNEKKYDYQNQINDYRDARPRTPSSSEYNKYKYQRDIINSTQNDLSAGVSHGKLKRIAKNYASGLGNNNFSQINHEKTTNKYRMMSSKDEPTIQIMDVETKQNINNRNIQNKRQGTQGRQKQKSYIKRYNEQEIKDSFQRINEDKIFHKINRINKLNSQINGRLQRILSKVSPNQ